MLVFTCTDGDNFTAQNIMGDSYPTCRTGGAWIEVEAYSGVEMDWASFEAERASAAYGAGFALMGTGMALSWAVAVVVNRITRKG